MLSNDSIKAAKQRSGRQSAAAACVMTVICGIFSLFQPLYTQVDNYLASLVTNRIYDSDNYCMFLNPVLCRIVGILQKLCPDGDAFTLLSRVMILAGIWYLSYFAARTLRKNSELVCAYLILFLLVINASLFFDYFTIWAAFFSFAGMILLLYGIRHERRWSDVTAGTLFLACGIMWRVESAAIFVPFVGLELFIEFVFVPKTKEERSAFVRKACGTLVPAVLCVLALLSIDYGFKHSEKYKYGVDYNNAVSAVVDFPMEDYEKVKDLLPGVSRNDYESLQVRLYADTDRVTMEYSKRIADAGSIHAVDLSVKGLLESMRVLLSAVLASKKTLFYWGLLFLFLLLIVLSDVKWYYKLELFLTYCGAWLIMLYFSFVGRIPLRVINSVTYAVFGMVLLLFLAEEWKSEKINLKWIKGFLFAAAAVVACMDTISYDFISPQSVFEAKKGADESRWESTYKEGILYLWQTNEYVQRPMRDFIDQGKIMTEDFLKHNLCYGEWTYGQVYFRNYLERLGVPNPMKALLDRKETYYVAEDSDLVLTYLREHYDEKVQVVRTGEIDGIPVWKFTGGNN